MPASLSRIYIRQQIFYLRGIVSWRLRQSSSPFIPLFAWITFMFGYKTICEGWERIFNCQRNNIGNISYTLDLRKSSLASKLRQKCIVWNFSQHHASSTANSPGHIISSAWHLDLWSLKQKSIPTALQRKRYFPDRRFAWCTMGCKDFKSQVIPSLIVRSGFLCTSHLWAFVVILPTQSQLFSLLQPIVTHAFLGSLLFE